MSLSEALFFDAVMLAAATALIYFMYNAEVKLSRQPKGVSRRFILALRTTTLGVVIALIYTIVDIPWNFVLFYFPDVMGVDVLKYVFIYAIISTIVVIPAVNVLLKAPFGERERERSAFLAERDDLLQQLRITTSKYLKKTISEDVFRDLCRELQGKIISVESKLEKLKIEVEEEKPRELFGP